MTTAPRGLATRVISAAAERAPARWMHPLTARLNRRAEPEMRLLIDRCDPDGRALDIGAWYGPWTYWLSRRVRAVDAFEPNPDVAAALRAGARDNVTVHQAAVSDTVGQATLKLQVLGVGSEGTATIEASTDAVKSIDVSTVRIDDFGFDDVRLLKIDVEGHEQTALSGAVETLDRCHPVLFVEVDSRRCDIDGVVRWLGDLGYSGRFLMNGTWTSTAETDLARFQDEFRRDHADQNYLQTVVRQNGYVNDIAFTHPSSTWSPWD